MKGAGKAETEILRVGRAEAPSPYWGRAYLVPMQNFASLRESDRVQTV
jgi:hypothetical protein